MRVYCIELARNRAIAHWNLMNKGDFETAMLPSVEKLSSSRRLGRGPQKCVLCYEVVPFSEGPLLDVQLYN